MSGPPIPAREPVPRMRRRAVLALVLAAPTAEASARAVVLSPANATIAFRLSLLGFLSINGVFRSFRGTGVIDPDDLSASRLGLVIDTASADTGDPAVNEDLASPALFDTARYPEAFFDLEQVFDVTANAARMMGHLTIKGVRRLESFDLSLPPRRSANAPWVFLASGTIRRSNYGLTGRRSLVGDETRLMVEVRID